MGVYGEIDDCSWQEVYYLNGCADQLMVFDDQDWADEWIDEHKDEWVSITLLEPQDEHRI